MKQLPFILYFVLMFFPNSNNICGFDCDTYLGEKLDNEDGYCMIGIHSYDILKLNESNKKDVLYFDLFFCGYEMHSKVKILIKNNDKVLKEVFATKIDIFEYRLEIPVNIFFNSNKLKKYKEFEIELSDTQENSFKTWERPVLLLEKIIIE